MTNSNKKSKHLNNLSLNHIGFFPVALLKRKETLDETLDLFSFEDTWGRNTNILDRTSHLYRNSESKLEPVKERLLKHENFTNVKINHKSSHLGLPYQVSAMHENGFVLNFDGLMFFVTKLITDKEISLEDIHNLTGIPSRLDDLLFDFEEAIRDLLGGIYEHSYATYSYYSADVIDWKHIDIKNSGNAQIRLLVNDEGIVTITGLTHVEHGQLYDVYIGDTIAINEMNSRDMFFYSEYERYAAHIESVRESISTASFTVFSAMIDVTKPFFYFFTKYNSWNNAKKSIASTYEIKNGLYKYDLFIEALKKVTNTKWAVQNNPKQIWLDGEEMDDQWKSSSWKHNFFGGKLINGKICELENKPISLRYSGKVKELEIKIKLLKNETNESVDDGRDLLSGIQTELSMYAVWIAIIALLFSGVAGILSNGVGAVIDLF